MTLTPHPNQELAATLARLYGGLFAAADAFGLSKRFLNEEADEKKEEKRRAALAAKRVRTAPRTPCHRHPRTTPPAPAPRPTPRAPRPAHRAPRTAPYAMPWLMRIARAGKG